jgi:diaminohydroxyphosphoribosylaminopyrimidine deaminase/5-amino-6-(5-phosphoribosylamino)uracil reductase
MSGSRDLAFMEMAYALAEKARGRASPNPLVGSVIVRNGVIVGTGYHREAGTPHAEVLALRQAGRRARGATIYITLEPCVHWGRTPPCVDTLLRSGLRRAVISASDPNPLVDRRGIARLRRSGMEVCCGLLKEKNARMNEAYAKYITRKTPFVTLKAALSLDGKIACRTRDSRWISAGRTREYVHLLRGEHDALLVGINTLIEDDPLLTVRHPNWGDKKITRVVLDSGLRFPLRAKILSSLESGRIIVFARTGAPLRKAEALARLGVEVVLLGDPRRTPSLGSVLAELGRREIASLLVEGGGRILTAFIEGKFADKLVLTLTPKLIGGLEAPGFYGGAGAGRIAEALRIRETRHFRLDEDIILEGYF